MPKKEKEIEPIDGVFDNVVSAMVESVDTKVLKYALLSGPLPIGGVELQCAVLNDETRI